MFYGVSHMIFDFIYFFFFGELMQDKSISCNEPWCYLRASGKHNALLRSCGTTAGLHSEAEMVRVGGKMRI